MQQALNQMTQNVKVPEAKINKFKMNIQVDDTDFYANKLDQHLGQFTANNSINNKQESFKQESYNSSYQIQNQFNMRTNPGQMPNLPNFQT